MQRSTVEFWAGKFGNEYNERNRNLVENNARLFDRALMAIDEDPQTILELGCGTGQNLAALSELLPDAQMAGIEPNMNAAQDAMKWADVQLLPILQAERRTCDLVLCKGILIHIAPDDLDAVYDVMAECARKWILICEYHNPTPVSVPYRGETGVLWKRDFAKHFIDRHPEFQCIDCGFAWKYARYPQDDITWFLLQRKRDV